MRWNFSDDGVFGRVGPRIRQKDAATSSSDAALLVRHLLLASSLHSTAPPALMDFSLKKRLADKICMYSQRYNMTCSSTREGGRGAVTTERYEGEGSDGEGCYRKI